MYSIQYNVSWGKQNRTDTVMYSPDEDEPKLD